MGKITEIAASAISWIEKKVYVFDILSPLTSSLWLGAVVLVSIFTTSSHTANIIMAITEAIALGLRQPVSFTSWLSDTLNYNASRANNKPLANVLRGSQLFANLLAFNMLCVSLTNVVVKQIGLAWDSFRNFLNMLPLSGTLANIVYLTSFTPFVSMVACTLGAGYYIYRATYNKKQAHEAGLQLRIFIYGSDTVNNDYYDNLFKKNAPEYKLQSSKKMINYLTARQKLEEDKHNKEKLYRSAIFWGVNALVGLGVATLMAVALFTPLGPMSLGITTVAIAVKITAIAVSLISAAFISIFYWIVHGKQAEVDAKRVKVNAHVLLLKKELEKAETKNTTINCKNKNSHKERTISQKPVVHLTKAASKKTSTFNHSPRFFHPKTPSAHQEQGQPQFIENPPTTLPNPKS